MDENENKTKKTLFKVSPQTVHDEAENTVEIDVQNGNIDAKTCDDENAIQSESTEESVAIDVCLTADEMVLYDKFKKMMQKEKEKEEQTHFNDEILERYSNIELGGWDLMFSPSVPPIYRLLGLFAKCFEYMLIGCILEIIRNKPINPSVTTEKNLEIHQYGKDSLDSIWSVAMTWNGTIKGTPYGVSETVETVGLQGNERRAVTYLGFFFAVYIFTTMVVSMKFSIAWKIRHFVWIFDAIELIIITIMQVIIVLQYTEFELDLILNGVAMLFVAEIDEATVSMLGGNNKDIKEYVILATRKHYVKKSDLPSEKIDLQHCRIRNLLKGFVGLQNSLTEMTESDMAKLAEMLPSSKLIWLNLSQNQITDAGAIKLAEMLPSSKLLYLYLSSNKITDAGAIKLAEMLPSSKLTVLYLSDNKITDAGAIKLAEMLPSSKLTSLGLPSNKITVAGKNALKNIKNKDGEEIKIDI
eukprot:g3030.t1